MHHVTDSFDRSYQATPASVGRVRADVADFAVAHGVDAAGVADIRLAVSEAVSNAVLHGYRGTTGTVRVTARHDDGALSISIRDFGCGMQPRPMDTGHSGMGLGLALIGRVMAELSVAPQGGDGTDVQMRFGVSSDVVRADRHAALV